MFIKSPNNKELVPFESWSGGEGQRLRIAGTLGMASFIRSRRGSFDCFFLDEPTTWLSESGVDDLITLLEGYSEDNKLKTFLIDHRNLETKGNFNNTIKIIKEQNNNIIEVN